jgi:peptidoglycan/LPS O-acetylase OafA/YrhL
MSKKLLYLEGLRGIASYGVFLVHFLDGYWENGLSWIKFKQDFNIYVALFFILSGRILTVSSLISRNVDSIAVSFCKRPLRLGLPLIALTALNSLVLKLRHDWSYSFLQIFFQPIYFMVYGGDVNKPIPGVAWTMPIEFMGSMTVYILTLVILYFDSKRGMFIIFCITIGFTIFTHSWISHFLVGLMIAVFNDGLSFLRVKGDFRIFSKANVFKITLCFAVFFLCFDSPIGIGKNFAVFLRAIQVYYIILN